jgi:NTP pyrophosphatase (non-canonical NTP hydrolase)
MKEFKIGQRVKIVHEDTDGEYIAFYFSYAIPAESCELVTEASTDVKEAANLLQQVCHAASYDAGWWHDAEGNTTKDNPLTFSNKLMLIVSEIAEAMEGDRKDCMDDKLPHRKMAEVELADAVIRIMDLSGAYRYDIGGAIAEKMEFNRSRIDHSKDARQSVGGKKY